MLDFCLRVRICSKHSAANIRVPKLFIQLKYLLSSKLRDIYAEPNLFLHRQGRRFQQGPRNAKGRFESTSGQKKTYEKEVICFECKEPGHYKSECPKLKKDRNPKK